jgi:FkbM family methyltransferase
MRGADEKVKLGCRRVDGAFMRQLLKPEWIWRPRQAWRRLLFRPSDEFMPLPLPWDCTISARSAEIVGRCIATHGLYDLPLTEAITRLTDAGDSALDIGANIGYITLVLARSAGPAGRVLCFEPNPALLPTLRTNVDNWKSLQVAPIQIETFAISERNGDALLGFPEDYARNQGLASLELKKDGVPVSVRRLDSMEIKGAGIMKLDVEGHEAAALSGAEGLLAGGQIRDILFEEHGSYPARSHKILLEHRYNIFRVTGSIWRPLLLPPEAPPRRTFLPPTYPPCYLATADPSRAHARFAPWGWSALTARLRRNEGVYKKTHPVPVKQSISSQSDAISSVRSGEINPK